MSRFIYFPFILIFTFTAMGVAQTRIDVIGRAGSSIGSGMTSVITREDIERVASSNLGDLLTRQGFMVQPSGPSGVLASLRLRGAESRHVLVLIDDVPINDPADPGRAFDFSKIQSETIERIEVLRGPHPVKNGAQAMGGVIKIYTRSARSDEGGQIRVDGGSFETYGQGLSLHGGSDTFQHSLSLQRRESEAYSAASEHRNYREADGYVFNTAHLSLRYTHGNIWSVQSQHLYENSRNELDRVNVQGLPEDDPNFSGRTTMSSHSIHALRSGLNSHVKLWGGLYTMKRQTEDKPDDTSSNLYYDSFEGQSQRIGGEWRTGLQGSLTWSLGTNYDRENMNSFYYSFVDPWGSSTDVQDPVSAEKSALYLQSDGRRGFLAWSAGVRWEEHSHYTGIGVWSLGSEISTGPILWSAKAATAVNWPSLYQRFVPNFGNMNLAPERSRGYDLGAETRALGPLVRVTLFHTSYQNLIDFLNTRYENTAEAQTRGVEAFAEHKWSPVYLRLTYTFLEARNQQTGEALLRRPKHHALLSGGVQPTNSIYDAYALLEYRGERLETTGASVTDGLLVHLGIEVQLMESLKTWIRIDNLWDKKYEPVLGYTGAPRQWRGGLNYDF